MTLRTRDGNERPNGGTSPEAATIQRTITATVAVPQCMRDQSTPGSLGSFCGEHGICAGPSGCKCDLRWYGIRCNNQSEELVAPEFVWRGWTVLFVIVIIGARRAEHLFSSLHGRLADDRCSCDMRTTAAVGCCGFVWFGGFRLSRVVGAILSPANPGPQQLFARTHPLAFATRCVCTAAGVP